MTTITGQIDLEDPKIVRLREPLGGLLQSFKESILILKDKNILNKIQNNQTVKICGNRDSDNVNVETIEVLNP